MTDVTTPNVLEDPVAETPSDGITSHDTITVLDETNPTNKLVPSAAVENPPSDETASTSEYTESDSEKVELFETLNDKMHVFQQDFQTIVKAFKKSALNAEKAQRAEKCYDNASLQQLVQYGSSSDESDSDSDSDDSSGSTESSSTDSSLKLETSSSADTAFRSQENDDSSDSESSDEDSSSSSDSESSSKSVQKGGNAETSKEKKTASKKKEPTTEIMAKGELRLCDLPPIENLHITVPEVKCTKLGTVSSVVDILVVIEALQNMPPLDIDTILFLNKGHDTLGKIFDVFGPVNAPCYTVRFNNEEEIKSKNISVGTEVFCAPSTEHTNYVLMSDLMKVKGSDASWTEDIEPPIELLDYSDDEEERRVRAKKKNKDRTDNTQRDNAWEQRKNERNTYLNQVNNSKWWQAPPRPRYNQNVQRFQRPMYPTYHQPYMMQPPVMLPNPFAFQTSSMPPGYVSLQQLVTMPPPPPPRPRFSEQPPVPGESSPFPSYSSAPDV